MSCFFPSYLISIENDDNDDEVDEEEEKKDDQSSKDNWIILKQYTHQKEK
jgi:hypothetical protein